MLLRCYDRQLSHAHLGLASRLAIIQAKFIVELVEERMLDSSLCCDSLRWLQLEHLAKEIDYLRIILIVFAQIP